MDSKTYEYISERIRKYKDLENKIRECDRLIKACNDDSKNGQYRTVNDGVLFNLPPGTSHVISMDAEKYMAELRAEQEKI